jgi:hypothetical protein
MPYWMEAMYQLEELDKQSINHSVSQSINKYGSQSLNQYDNKSINQQNSQSTGQLDSQSLSSFDSLSQPIFEADSQSSVEIISPSLKQCESQSTNQFDTESISHPAHSQINSQQNDQSINLPCNELLKDVDDIDEQQSIKQGVVQGSILGFFLFSRTLSFSFSKMFVYDYCYLFS